MKTFEITFTEEIRFNSNNCIEDIHRITLHSGYDMFVVHCSYDPNWEHIFCSEDTSKFSQVRRCITDAIDKHEEVEELLDHLNCAFEDQFADLLAS